ncbi:MAG: hypothetical protein HOM90_10360 [Porticoccaceae bacterium]|jgi:hypothetical protein|nr:hypothetical protein [Porticoccaceae bacterium]MBT3797843.1 hypothetical protein [Porticoccaceae bacterium]MBT4164037.1 hypothetical protein [Porticoccaceae bacterium]MBT4211962.1 hypothetical protein [Porticoccaceae bacterium]MBT4591918.1 hypothetical protein [Porticoccaceae bacterium]
MMRLVVLFSTLLMSLSSVALDDKAVGRTDENGIQADANDGVKTAAPSILERLKGISDLDPSKWGIRNGCVSLMRVKNIRFIDDQSAIIEMRGKKKALLRLRRECPGIKRDGFVHRSRGRQLCARFDQFEVIDMGIPCSIESIEPYVEIASDSGSGKDNTAGGPK